MSHECENCGYECYCDMDDCGGMPQPNDCRHFRKGECGLDLEFADDDDEYFYPGPAEAASPQLAQKEEQ